MRTRVVAGLFVAAAVAGGGLFVAGRPAAGGDKPPAAPAADHEFGNKVLVISTRATTDRPKGGSMILEKARVRRLGDRAFVYGRGVDFDAADWYAGAGVWVDLQDVDMVVEYDTLEALKKSYKQRQID